MVSLAIFGCGYSLPDRFWLVNRGVNSRGSAESFWDCGRFRRTVTVLELCFQLRLSPSACQLRFGSQCCVPFWMRATCALTGRAGTGRTHFARSPGVMPGHHVRVSVCGLHACGVRFANQCGVFKLRAIRGLRGAPRPALRPVNQIQNQSATPIENWHLTCGFRFRKLDSVMRAYCARLYRDSTSAQAHHMRNSTCNYERANRDSLSTGARVRLRERGGARAINVYVRGLARLRETGGVARSSLRACDARPASFAVRRRLHYGFNAQPCASAHNAYSRLRAGAKTPRTNFVPDQPCGGDFCKLGFAVS